jgi:8-oxo-dGTP pyrophosphatase MutT (NUDIX family)
MKRKAKILFVSPSNKVLLGQRTSKGETFWWLPGGSVEEGETDFEAAVRELGEEMKLSKGLIDAISSFVITNNNKFEYESNAYNIVFKIPVLETATLSVPEIIDEFEKLKWIDANNLPSNMSHEYRQLLAQWKIWFD